MPEQGGPSPGRSAPARALADRVRAIGRTAGLDAVGITSAEPFLDTKAVLEERGRVGLAAGMQFTYRNPGRSTDPGRLLKGARCLVVAARGYERAPLDLVARVHPAGGSPGVPGRVARYSWVDHYAELRTGLDAMAAELRGEGWRAVSVADDNALVDRAAAHRAGIGWYGKNTNILIPDAGSWFVLGSVVTDAPLPCDVAVTDGCGSCNRCLPACPTGALVAPGVLDARRCLAWLVQAPGVFPSEHRVALGDRLYGCDDCQEVCPVNRRHTRRQPPPPAEAGATAAVDALGLLAASDVELLARYGRWYLAGRQVRWLRRNALLILGNVGDRGSAEVVEALRTALSDPDPALRGPAVWAAARLGLHRLLPATDDDEDVSAELAAVAQVPAQVPLR